MNWLLVGLGGAVGSMLRYGIYLLAGQTRFPWATLTVNLTGSLLLGFVASWAMVRWNTTVTTALAVGLLGGFTTFSALSWEGLSFVLTGRTDLAVGYFLVSVFGGLAMAFAGLWVGRAFG